MKLTGPQPQQLHAALMNAFPVRPALERMVRFNLGENLNAFAGDSNLSDTVFRLITWAESQGRLLELLTGACAQNPDNDRRRTWSLGLFQVGWNLARNQTILIARQ